MLFQFIDVPLFCPMEYDTKEATSRNTILYELKILLDSHKILMSFFFFNLVHFYSLCIQENDELAEKESNRIRCELEEKAAEQPELLKGYLIEFTRCLLPWTRSSTKNSDCSIFGKF